MNLCNVVSTVGLQVTWITLSNIALSCVCSHVSAVKIIQRPGFPRCSPEELFWSWKVIDRTLHQNSKQSCKNHIEWGVFWSWCVGQTCIAEASYGKNTIMCMWMLMDTLFPPVKINFRPLNILHIAWVVDAASFCSSQITDQVYLHVFMFFSAHWVFPDIFNYFQTYVVYVAGQTALGGGRGRLCKQTTVPCI